MINEYSMSLRTTHIGYKLAATAPSYTLNSLRGRYNRSPSEALGIDRVWCGCSQAAQTWAFLSVCLSVSRRRKAGSSWCWWAMARATSGWRSRRERRCLERVIAAPRPRPASPDGVVIDHPAPSFLNTAVFSIPTVPDTVRRSSGFVADHLLGSAFAPSANMGTIWNNDLAIFSIFSW